MDEVDVENMVIPLEALLYVAAEVAIKPGDINNVPIEMLNDIANACHLEVERREAQYH